MHLQTPGQIRFFTQDGQTQTVFYPLPLSESCHQAGDFSATILGCNLYLKSSSPVKSSGEGDAGPATPQDRGAARPSPGAMEYPLGIRPIPCSFFFLLSPCSLLFLLSPFFFKRGRRLLCLLVLYFSLRFPVRFLFLSSQSLFNTLKYHVFKLNLFVLI